METHYIPIMFIRPSVSLFTYPLSSAIEPIWTKFRGGLPMTLESRTLIFISKYPLLVQLKIPLSLLLQGVRFLSSSSYFLPIKSFVCKNAECTLVPLCTVFILQILNDRAFPDSAFWVLYVWGRQRFVTKLSRQNHDGSSPPWKNLSRQDYSMVNWYWRA